MCRNSVSKKIAQRGSAPNAATLGRSTMKTIIAIALATTFAAPVLADQIVKGHVRSDGTYVAPYVRSTPNSVQSDNYSTKGNTNPYTGDRGSQRDTTYDYKPYKPDNRR